MFIKIKWKSIKLEWLNFKFHENDYYVLEKTTNQIGFDLYGKLPIWVCRFILWRSEKIDLIYLGITFITWYPLWNRTKLLKFWI